MALFDFLKRKKEVAKSKPAKKVDKVLVTTPQKDSEINTELRQRKNAKSFSYSIIKEPHISEKATDLAQKNQYTFKVYANTNKPEIKKSVEGIYGVNVLDVKVIKIPGKKRRIGRTEGFKKGFSKAIVTVKEGQKIEIF